MRAEAGMDTKTRSICQFVQICQGPNSDSICIIRARFGCKHVYFFRQPSSTHVNTCQRNAFDATFGRRDAHPPAPWRCTPESHTQPGRSEQSSIFLDLAGSPHEHTNNFTVYKREGADVTTSGFGFCMAAVGFGTPLLIGRE